MKGELAMEERPSGALLPSLPGIPGRPEIPGMPFGPGAPGGQFGDIVDENDAIHSGKNGVYVYVMANADRISGAAQFWTVPLPVRHRILHRTKCASAAPDGHLPIKPPFPLQFVVLHAMCKMNGAKECKKRIL